MNLAVEHERISELFLAVCDLSEDAKTSYLDHACSDSPDIRAQVEAMLAEDSRVENLLAGPNPQPRERGGTQIGSRHDPAAAPTAQGCVLDMTVPAGNPK